MYDRILVPLDGSDTARRGLVEGLSFAVDRKSTICLLHVMDGLPPIVGTTGLLDFEQHRRELRAFGQKLLGEATEACAALGVAAETHLFELRGERVCEAIIGQARALGCELIVIGTHGRRGLRRALLGSAAESVVRESPLPVLLVPAETGPESPRTTRHPGQALYRRIFVPVDGSETSGRGLDEAIRLAALTKGRLRLLHVVDEQSMAMAIDASITASMDWLGMLREGGAALLQAAERRVREAGLPVDSVLLDTFEEALPEVVARAALNWEAELIVLGTHGRRGASRFVLGSDAEQILRVAPVPVLLVRAAGATALRAA